MRSSSMSCSLRQAVDVREVLDEALLQQRRRQRLAQAIDVHGATTGEVHQQPEDLRRAGAVGAVAAHLAFRPRDRLAALGALAPGPCTRSLSPSRRLTTGPTTWGMTSPARWTITVSPMRMSLRRMSSSLCSVASLTARVRDDDRVEHGERVQHAGAPDVEVDAQQLGRRLGGRVLEGDGPARLRPTTPRARCRLKSSTLITRPSIS